MASTSLNYADLSIGHDTLQQLNQIMFGAITAPDRLGEIFNVQKGVTTGDLVTVFGDFGLRGTIEDCDVEWEKIENPTPKQWDLHNHAINIELCYLDIPKPFLRLLSNTEGADARRNVYVDEILRPRLEIALKKMYFRLAWFGLANAKEDKYNKYFLGGLGFVGQLYMQMQEGKEGYFVNTDQTKSYTHAEIIALVDEMIDNASPALRQADEQRIYMSLKLADKLEGALKATNVGSDLQWRSLFDGVKMGSYRGIKVIVMPQFDEISAMLEDSYSLFAVYTTKTNMQLGTQGENEVAEITVDYDPRSKSTLLSARDMFGAMIAQNDIVSVIGFVNDTSDEGNGGSGDEMI